MNIRIIGNGVWGKAMYHVLRTNNSKVAVIKRGEEITDADLIVLAIPTQAIREALTLVSNSRKHKIVVNATKGIENSTHKLPYQIVKDVLGIHINYFTLVGPSFAEEIMKNMPTLVNLGYREKNKYNQRIQSIFQTDYFRIRLTEGIETLELSAALKNVYAIGCGFAEGLGYETNTRVKLITLAIEEMQKLFRNLGLHVDSRATAGTVGDLILTCNSAKSRNFRFGKLLTRYYPDLCLKKIGETVEGYKSIQSINYFEEKAQTKLPLAEFITHITKTKNRKSIGKDFKNFIKKS